MADSLPYVSAGNTTLTWLTKGYVTLMKIGPVATRQESKKAKKRIKRILTLLILGGDSVISMIWEIFWYLLHVCRTKLTILKICLTIVTLMILGNLKAAPEVTMQLRGLIKGSNWSLGHYLFRSYEFWKFWPPIAQIPGGVAHPPPPQLPPPPKKRPALIGLKGLEQSS